MRKLCNLGRLSVVHGHTQNHQAILAILLLQIYKPWHLDLARRTPRCPEVQQHGLAAKIRELHPPAVQRGQFEVGSRDIAHIADQLYGAVVSSAIKVFSSSQHGHNDHRQHYENDSTPIAIKGTPLTTSTVCR